MPMYIILMQNYDKHVSRRVIMAHIIKVRSLSTNNPCQNTMLDALSLIKSMVLFFSLLVLVPPI